MDQEEDSGIRNMTNPRKIFMLAILVHGKQSTHVGMLKRFATIGTCMMHVNVDDYPR